MKRIYINETQVESVAIDFTDLPDFHRVPRTYSKLRAHLKRSETAVTSCDRCRVISQIGGVDVDPMAFTFEIREDGVHLFVPAMLNELGAFAGLSGCCFELWAMARETGPATSAPAPGGKIQCIGASGIRYMITEKDLLRKFKALAPEFRGVLVATMDGMVSQKMERERQRPRVIQFPAAASRG